MGNCGTWKVCVLKMKLTNEQIEKQKEINRIIRYWEGKKRYAQMRIDENVKKYADITSKALEKIK